VALTKLLEDAVRHRIIDRVSIALCIADGADPYHHCTDYGDEELELWTTYRQMARAAVKEVRLYLTEPDDNLGATKP
jgi:hypothetical protein